MCVYTQNTPGDMYWGTYMQIVFIGNKTCVFFFFFSLKQQSVCSCHCFFSSCGGCILKFYFSYLVFFYYYCWFDIWYYMITRYMWYMLYYESWFYNRSESLFKNMGHQSRWFSIFLLILPKHVDKNWNFQGALQSSISSILKQLCIYLAYSV